MLCDLFTCDKFGLTALHVHCRDAFVTEVGGGVEGHIVGDAEVGDTEVGGTVVGSVVGDVEVGETVVGSGVGEAEVGGAVVGSGVGVAEVGEALVGEVVVGAMVAVVNSGLSAGFCVRPLCS